MQPKRDRPPTLDEMRAEVAAERAEAMEAYRLAFRAAFRAEMAELDAAFVAQRGGNEKLRKSIRELHHE